MSDFSMDWWYNPTSRDPIDPTEQQRDEVDSNEDNARYDLPAGSNEGGGNAMGGDDPFRNINESNRTGDSFFSGNTNTDWGQVGMTAAEWAARIGGGALGFLEGALLGGNVLTAGSRAVKRGDQAGDFLRDDIFKRYLDEGQDGFVGAPRSGAGYGYGDAMPGGSGYGSTIGGGGNAVGDYFNNDDNYDRGLLLGNEGGGLGGNGGLGGAAISRGFGGLGVAATGSNMRGSGGSGGGGSAPASLHSQAINLGLKKQ